MATSVDEQFRTDERQRSTRPPGWRPDGHTGPGDWLTVTVAISIIALALIVVGMWSLLDGSVTEMATLGDAYELESLGAWSQVTVEGDALELERLGAWTAQTPALGDALELERIGTVGLQWTDLAGPGGDASELERLGAWTD